MLAVLYISNGVPFQCVSTSGYSWDEAREKFKKMVSEFFPNRVDEVNQEIMDNPDFDGFEFNGPLEAMWIIDVE